jgi:formylglycine-generating enzyme required for sulfatase activity
MTAGIVVIATAIVAAAAAPALAAEKYALVVGVNEYLPTELPSLKYAEADAEAVAAALDKLGFSVVTMTSRAGVAFRPTTADKIVAQAARRLEDRDPGDTVVIALSGHGVQFKGDGDFYFCPSEAKLSSRDSLVPMSRLMREIGGCRAGRKLLLVDACRDELTPESAGKGGVVIELEPAGVFRAEPPAGTVALLSCRAKEKSFEVAALGHSVFTHHVVEYLSGRAPADRYPSAGDVSVSELATFVRSRTRDYVDRELAQRQTPDVITPDGTLAEWPLGKLGEGRRPAGGEMASVTPRPLPAVPPVPVVPRPAAGPRPGETTENSLGMKLVVIPAGEFEMGGRETVDELKAAGFFVPEGYDTSDERPVHRVKITKPFLMGVHEVTLGEFLAFYNDGYKGKLDCEKDGKGGVGYDPKNPDKPFEQKPEYRPWNWGHPDMDLSTAAGKERAFRQPVVNVSWNDCVAFCEWLSRKEGKTYRLPTEAEWEYACRAGSKTRFWNGDHPEGLATIDNVLDGAASDTFSGAKQVAIRSRDGHVFTAPVGSFDRANPFGLHDMHGNVAEWCGDWYDEKYYATSPAADPKGPSSAGSFRVLRGGSWYFCPVFCRSARRDDDPPTPRFLNVGFRVVVELE